MKKKRDILMEHYYTKQKKENGVNDEANIDLGFEKLIDTAIAQINNNNE